MRVNVELLKATLHQLRVHQFDGLNFPTVDGRKIVQTLRRDPLALVELLQGHGGVELDLKSESFRVLKANLVDLVVVGSVRRHTVKP